MAPVIFVHDTDVSDRVLENIEASFSRGLPRFARMPGLGSATGPVAIVAGGPSLRGELDNLRNFPGPVISCGTSYDYLIDNGIAPEYHVDGEPDADGVMPCWLKRANQITKYLIASQCPQTTFDALRGHDIWLWHCALRNEGDDCFRGEPAVPGGCTNLMRAWPIAAIMGHTDIHFFGFDCSFPADCHSQHAYAYDWTLDEVCAATCGGERFLTAPMWLAQLEVFVQMVKQAKGKFQIAVHGHSLASRAMELI